MSQVKITGNASGTGVLTIAAPNTNTDRTINIPDTAGDIVTTGDSATITGGMLDGGQSGSAPIFGARAWVNFNGSGTVAIRASGNVSSVTDVSTGIYTINFTTDMEDVNYAVACATSYISGVTHEVHYVPGGADAGYVATGSLKGDTRRTDTNANVDLTYIHIVIYR